MAVAKATSPAKRLAVWGGAIVALAGMGAIIESLNQKGQEIAAAPATATRATAALSPVPATPTPSASVKRDARALAGENVGPVRIADLDEADKAIRLTINLSGHLCAKPILVRPAGGDHYGVTCILYRSGKGRANYLVQSSTGKVTAL